jgi:acetyl esterase/lipase
VPSTVSPQAQASRAAEKPKASYPPVDDAQAWRDRRDSIDRQVIPMFAALTANLPITSRTLQLGGVTVYEAVPTALSDAVADCIHIEIHGGALVAMGGDICRMLGGSYAVRYGLRTLSVDYRMPPDHPYPAALDDCIAVYRAVLERYAPSHIVISGSSAGGNLAAALALRARDEGLPLPAAMVLTTPEVDLTESGDSFQTNLGVDTNLSASLMPANLVYAGGHDLTDPYVSPLFGDFTRGFPPTFLASGTRDLFLSNTVRLHRALRRAKVETELHVFEAMPHGGFFGSPEDAELDGEARRFLLEALSRR